MTEVNRHRGAEHQRALTGLVRILPRGQPPVRCGRASEERTMPRIDAVKTGGGSTYCHQCGSEIGYVNFCPHCEHKKRNIIQKNTMQRQLKSGSIMILR